MPAIAQGLSHSPVVKLRPLDSVRQTAFDSAVEDARRALQAFDPEVVVVFGPDHYNGFFYNMMPPYCVGQRAFGIGDYGTLKGKLDVDAASADGLHRYLLENQFDTAVSHDMHLDHGFTQCLEQLFSMPPGFVPVFLNCVAHPIASCGRVISLGHAVGNYFRTLNKRVAFIGSGGLSHDAPLPSLGSLPQDARDQLVKWHLLTPEERAERERRTLDAADHFASGDSPLARLNPAWDRQIMAQISRGDWIGLTALKDDDITRNGGRSAHELRTWLAAFSALSAFGSFAVEQSAYIEVPEWVVGYGALRARTS